MSTAPARSARIAYKKTNKCTLKFLREKILRVKLCPECKYYFHMTAHNIALAADAVLRTGQRPNRFILPFVRVNTDEQCDNSRARKRKKIGGSNTAHPKNTSNVSHPSDSWLG